MKPMCRGVALVAAAVLFGWTAAAPVAAADGDSGVSFAATLDGRTLSDVDANEPLRLEPGRDVLLDLTVRNEGAEAVSIKSVRFEGRVVGLTFFTFSTRVDLVVPPSDEGARRYTIDLGDLGEQATGLIPAQLALLDDERNEIAAQQFPVDVRGSLTSIYAVFALGIAATTLLLSVGLVLRLFAGRLPTNRWSRAIRFVWPGAGLGLTLAFSASAVRLAVPSPRIAIAMLVVGSGVGFVAGYLSPQRAELSDDLDDGDVVDDGLDASDMRAAGLGARDDDFDVIDLRDPPVTQDSVAVPVPRHRATSQTETAAGTESS